MHKVVLLKLFQAAAIVPLIDHTEDREGNMSAASLLLQTCLENLLRTTSSAFEARWVHAYVRFEFVCGQYLYGQCDRPARQGTNTPQTECAAPLI